MGGSGGTGFAGKVADIDTGPDYQVVLLSKRGFDATAIDWKRAWVGNTKGIVAPVGRRQLDVNHDGLLDLVLTYPVEPTLTLSSSSSDQALRLHYRDGKGVDHWVPNVLQLVPRARIR